jgi:hypothetical protein
MHAIIDVPADRHAATAEFWQRVSGWPAGRPWAGHPELSSFEPADGTAYLHLQRIDGPPRVHLDLESDEPEVTVARAVQLGAEDIAENGRWHTLRSPGGLAFCVLRASARRAPPPQTWPDGHRSRLVQICLDSPRAKHVGESLFWRALLRYRWSPSDSAEFDGKWHAAGSPLQLLLQELDEETGPTRAHLDLGTDDLAAEVGRLLDAGATDVRPGRGWHVFEDVAGLPFCVTTNSPEQTRYRDIG